MRARVPFAAFALALSALTAAAEDDAASAFQRGINISMVFSFPEPAGWPPFRDPRSQVSDGELRALAAAGFDFVRLPVDPTPFFHAAQTQRKALFDDVARFVRRAGAAGLAVIVAGFPTHSETAWRPERVPHPEAMSFEDYAGWLEDLARSVDSARAPSGAAAVQLMNEPQSVCVIEDGTDWAEYQIALHERVRAVTEMPIVLTGGCWSTIDGLLALEEMPEDPATLFDVHYYEPFTYTHQGATWAMPFLAHVGKLQFPPRRTDRASAWQAVLRHVVADHPGSFDEAAASAEEALSAVDRYLAQTRWPEQIAEDFARVEHWADAQGIARHRIVIGEFGAIRPPAETSDDIASRQRYLRSVRDTAENAGFGWAMWEYYAPFGVVESDTSRRLSRGTLKALGLRND